MLDIVIMFTRRGPGQHGFMSGSKQWISESSYNNYAADHNNSIRRKSA